MLKSNVAANAPAINDAPLAQACRTNRPLTDGGRRAQCHELKTPVKEQAVEQPVPQVSQRFLQCGHEKKFRIVPKPSPPQARGHKPPESSPTCAPLKGIPGYAPARPCRLDRG